MPKLLRYLTVSFCLSTCNIDQCLWSEYDRACHSNIDHVPYHCNALQVQAVGRTGEEEESRGRGVNFGFRCWCFDHIVWAVFPFRETRLPVWIIYKNLPCYRQPWLSWGPKLRFMINICCVLESDQIEEDVVRTLREGVLLVSQRICLPSLWLLSLFILP